MKTSLSIAILLLGSGAVHAQGYSMNRRLTQESWARAQLFYAQAILVREQARAAYIANVQRASQPRLPTRLSLSSPARGDAYCHQSRSGMLSTAQPNVVRPAATYDVMHNARFGPLDDQSAAAFPMPDDVERFRAHCAAVEEMHKIQLESEQRLRAMERTPRLAAVRPATRSTGPVADKVTRRPRPLTADEFNRVTGKIFWPPLIESTRSLAKERERVERLFEQKHVAVGLSGANSGQDLRAAIKRMQKTLHAQLKKGTVSGPTWWKSKKFLESLAEETRREGKVLLADAGR